MRKQALMGFAGWVLLANAAVFGQTPQLFIPMQPCRVVATPWPNGTFGGPILAAGSIRSFPLPQGGCNIPTTASAYSLNLTAVPKGFLNYMTIWPTGITIPNVSVLNAHEGQVLANAAIVPAGINGAVSIYVTNTTDLLIDINGYFVPQSDPGNQNTAIGSVSAPQGTFNTGLGFNALQNNTGNNNTATGVAALSGGNSGPNNVALGFDSLVLNTLGGANTAVGSTTLASNGGGNDNTAVGYSALLTNTFGNFNTAVGATSLLGNTSGSKNIAVGYSAGSQITNGSNNIDIGDAGLANDNGVIRIGNSSNQTSTYIAGINSVNISGGLPVLINSNGQLGTLLSSRRYKENISDMADASSRLFQLRPVTFHYKHEPGNPAGSLQYGLLAEEVAKVYPELAVYGPNGQIESVQYQQLPSMLLNELQKQHKILAEQKASLEAEQNKIRSLELRIAELEKRLGQPMPAK